MKHWLSTISTVILLLTGMLKVYAVEGEVGADLTGAAAKPAASVEDIIAILTEMQIPYTMNGDKQIEFSIKGENAIFHALIIVDTKENELIYLAVPNLLTVSKDSLDADKIMTALMDLNYRSGLVKYEWNYDGGEVRASYLFHTQYYFSKKAFQDTLGELINSVDLAYPSLIELVNQEG